MKPFKIIILVIGSLVTLFIIASIVLVANMSPEERARIDAASATSKRNEAIADSIEAAKVKEAERLASIPVKSSDWDGSVHQVTDYLRKNLRDWDSYESIDWSPVAELNAGNTRYSVRHKYLAANGFGGMAIENQVFFMDASGNVIATMPFE